MAQSALKSCNICMSGPGHNYCEQCHQWMCENCKTLHLRSNTCRNHAFLNEEQTSKNETSNPSTKTVFRYQCDHCWNERLSENNPTSWPIHGRFFICKNCRFLRWFFLKE
ncbi:uncharacterized protein LOC143043663 isoform X1 [Mytilus galloprovincialis]|uniref:uncharacterized protein LOC143043663 isoform X1 n=1 Tax=Mytilus galloprovincialis TaxID=29158 RepID=UPI003F7B68F7